MGTCPHDTWVYRTVLDDGPKIKAVIEKHQLYLGEAKGV
jgi:hypothetical protein